MSAHLTLKFARLNGWPAGVRYVVLWNGRTAGNGDGVPGSDPQAAPAVPLTASPIEIWPIGKAGYGDELHGRGLHGRPGNWREGFGHGLGLHGVGEHGLYGDLIEWSTAAVLPSLRDGSYRFAVRFEDELGNPQSDPLQVVTVEVAGEPRPPTELRMIGFADGQLSLGWSHSPDLVDLAA